eukprot:scaffold76538_cov62-Attheya_sp.AAC.4
MVPEAYGAPGQICGHQNWQGKDENSHKYQWHLHSSRTSPNPLQSNWHAPARQLLTVRLPAACGRSAGHTPRWPRFCFNANTSTNSRPTPPPCARSYYRTPRQY